MNFPSVTREISSFHAAALILGGAALVSKLLGLLRDRLLASRFGAGVELDVYYAAFQIPDVLYTIFLIGAAAAAVLPVFMEYERRSAGQSEAFVSNLLTVFSIAGSVLVAVAIIAAPWLMRAVAPGFGPEQFRTAVWLTRLMMVNAVFLGVAGILSSRGSGCPVLWPASSPGVWPRSQYSCLLSAAWHSAFGRVWIGVSRDCEEW
jgi:putative peptidoglycan lipid II flippase